MINNTDKSYIFAIYDSKQERFGDIFVSGFSEFCDMLSNCYQNRMLLYGEFIPLYFQYPNDYIIYNLGIYNRGASIGDGSVIDVSRGPRVLSTMSALLDL